MCRSSKWYLSHQAYCLLGGSHNFRQKIGGGGSKPVMEANNNFTRLLFKNSISLFCTALNALHFTALLQVAFPAEAEWSIIPNFLSQWNLKTQTHTSARDGGSEGTGERDYFTQISKTTKHHLFLFLFFFSWKDCCKDLAERIVSSTVQIPYNLPSLQSCLFSCSTNPFRHWQT